MKYFFFIWLFILFIFPVFHQVYGIDWTLCPDNSTAIGCSHKGGIGLQQIIDEPGNTNTVTILIKEGVYTIPDKTGTPFDGRMGVAKCFVDLKGKNVTIKGEGNPQGEKTGSVLWGRGHEDPVHHSIDRAGICSNGGSVTIDNLHIKEFEGGGLYFSDAKVVIKNSVIDGHDHGGIFLIGASALFAVNNYWMAGGSIMPFGNPSIKAVNNTFYHTKSIISSISCQDDVPTNLDFVNNIVVDKEFTIGINGISNLPTECLGKVNQFKNRNIAYNILWKENIQCYPDHEFCDEIKNNKLADILLDPEQNPIVTDERGWRWGGFTVLPNSPILNSGDPSIPGKKEIGAGGGPCVNPASAVCDTFIQNNQPPDPPDPVEPPDDPPVNPNNPPNNKGTGNNPFGIPLPLSRLIDMPDNLILPKTLSQSTKSLTPNSTAFSLITYIIISVVYIMVMHFAVNMGSEFNVGLMVVFFVLGGWIGGIMQSYEMGFAGGVILSLMFISGPKKEM